MDTPDQADFRTSVRRWVDTEIAPNVAAWDEAGTFPRALYRRAAGYSEASPVSHSISGNF